MLVEYLKIEKEGSALERKSPEWKSLILDHKNFKLHRCNEEGKTG